MITSDEEFLPFGEYKSRDEQVAAVRRAMEAGHSNTSAAKLFGVKVGVIAGIRWKHKIPSRNEAPFPGEERRLREERREFHGRLKIAATEAAQCHEVISDFYSGHRCAFEQLPGSDRCPLHHVEKKRRA